MTARFGRGPSLPQASKTISDQPDVCTRIAPDSVKDSSASTHSEREPVNQHHVPPFDYRNRYKHSNYSSDASAYFAKKWNPIFSTRRDIREESRHIISKKLADPDPDPDPESSAIIFLSDYLEPSHATDEIVEFCQNARLADVKSGRGTAGVERAAWLDDRSLSGARNYPNLCITASGLYRRLIQPVRFLSDSIFCDFSADYDRKRDLAFKALPT